MSLQDIELDIVNTTEILDKYLSVAVDLYKLVNDYHDTDISISNLLENSGKLHIDISVHEMRKERFLLNNVRVLLDEVTTANVKPRSTDRHFMSSLRTSMEVTPSSVVSIKDDFF